MPTLVDIAGGPKGDELNEQIKAGKYPGIVKTKLDGVDQARLPGRQVGEVGARGLLLLHGLQPSAVRYKNWKMYYTMVPGTGTGAMGAEP